MPYSVVCTHAMQTCDVRDIMLWLAVGIHVSRICVCVASERDPERSHTRALALDRNVYTKYRKTVISIVNRGACISRCNTNIDSKIYLQYIEMKRRRRTKTGEKKKKCQFCAHVCLRLPRLLPNTSGQWLNVLSSIFFYARFLRFWHP